MSPEPTSPAFELASPLADAALSRYILRIGARRAIALITTASVVASVLTTTALMLLSGISSAPLWAVAFGASSLVPLLVASAVATIVVRLIFQLETARAMVQTLATTDSLTGVANRRHLVERAQLEFDRCRRHQLPLAVMMIDVDHFKGVNDRHGHPAGDAVLVEAARACRHTLRATDLLARYGGEEFLALLPLTDAEAAQRVAERVRAAIAALRVDNGGGTPLQVTVSVGLASLGSGTATVDELFSRADQALYAAKQKGRNRVEIAA